jgi:hypothetical protein
MSKPFIAVQEFPIPNVKIQMPEEIPMRQFQKFDICHLAFI